jgi:hypothetical protein
VVLSRVGSTVSPAALQSEAGLGRLVDGGCVVGKLRFKIGDDGVKPSDLDAAELGRYITELAEAFAAEGGHVSIESVSSGSIDLRAVVDERAFATAKSLRDGSIGEGSPVACWHRKWSQSFTKRNWPLHVDLVDGCEEAEERAEEADSPTEAWAWEYTTLFGDLAAVTASGTGAKLRLDTVQGMVWCNATREQAKVLGERMFEFVVLDVLCELDMLTLKRRNVSIERIVEFAPDQDFRSFADDMRRLNEERFRGLDIDAHIAAMRDDTCDD